MIELLYIPDGRIIRFNTIVDNNRSQVSLGQHSKYVGYSPEIILDAIARGSFSSGFYIQNELPQSALASEYAIIDI